MPLEFVLQSFKHEIYLINHFMYNPSQFLKKNSMCPTCAMVQIEMRYPTTPELVAK